MRPKLLKSVLKQGRLAIGVSAAVMIGRVVVSQLAKRTEKDALQQEQNQGAIHPHTNRRLRLLRVVRALLHIL